MKTLRGVVKDTTLPLAKMSLKGIIYNIFGIGVKLYKRLGGAVPDATLPLARIFLKE